MDEDFYLTTVLKDGTVITVGKECSDECSHQITKWKDGEIAKEMWNRQKIQDFVKTHFTFLLAHFMD